MTPKVLWKVVKDAAKHADMEKLAPHDLRRTCARLCRLAGGELDQIQFLLGHASVLTTERYLGCKQNLGHPVNDLFDLKTDVEADAIEVKAPSAQDGDDCGSECGGVQNPVLPKKDIHALRENDSDPTCEEGFVTLWDGAA